MGGKSQKDIFPSIIGIHIFYPSPSGVQEEPASPDYSDTTGEKWVEEVEFQDSRSRDSQFYIDNHFAPNNISARIHWEVFGKAEIRMTGTKHKVSRYIRSTFGTSFTEGTTWRNVDLPSIAQIRSSVTVLEPSNGFEEEGSGNPPTEFALFNKLQAASDLIIKDPEEALSIVTDFVQLLEDKSYASLRFVRTNTSAHEFFIERREHFSDR